MFFNFLLFHTLLPADPFPSPPPFQPCWLPYLFILPSPYTWLSAKGHEHFPPLHFYQVTPACTVLLQTYLAGAAKWCRLVWGSFLSLKSPVRMRCVFKLFSGESGLFVAAKTTFPTSLGWWAGVNCRLLVKAQCLCENRSEVIRLVTMCHYLWSQPFSNFLFIYAV